MNHDPAFTREITQSFPRHHARDNETEPVRSLIVLTSTLPRFEGDPEPRFVLDLSKQLARQYKVTVVAPACPDAALEEELEGVRVIRYRYAPFRGWEVLAYPGAILPRLKRNPLLWLLVPLLCLGLYRSVARLLRRNRSQCVHCHWLVPQGLVARFLAWRYGAPYVVTSHGADVFALQGRVFRSLRRAVLVNAAATTVVSNAIRSSLEEEFGRNALSVDVIPMGVDSVRFHPDRRVQDWPHQYGLRRPLIVFVGRLTEKKGLRFLLESLASEPLRSTAATLAIVGDGELRPELERSARTLGIDTRVRFLGALSHDQLPEVLASADIFCAPSVIAAGGDREGLPTVLCEAAASGVPAVATRVSGIAEIVTDGETGLLVNERDSQALAVALSRLATNDTLRLEMAKRSRQRGILFDWAHVARRFSEVIEAASNKRR